jgi:hypothetical protein
MAVVQVVQVVLMNAQPVKEGACEESRPKAGYTQLCTCWTDVNEGSSIEGKGKDGSSRN